MAIDIDSTLHADPSAWQARFVSPPHPAQAAHDVSTMEALKRRWRCADPRWAEVRSLCLRGDPFDDDGLRELAALGNLRAVQRVKLWHPNLTTRGLRALIDAAPDLELIDLHAARWDQITWSALENPPRAWALRGTPTAEFQSFLSAPWVNSIDTLLLYDLLPAASDIEAALTSLRVVGFKNLHLSSPRLLSSLLDSGARSLRDLTLHMCVGDALHSALQEIPASVEKIDLAASPLSTRSLNPLARPAYFHALRSLRLSYVGLSAEALHCIGEDTLAHLDDLDVSGNTVDDWPSKVARCSQLTGRLSFASTGLSDATLQKALSLGLANRLSALDVSGNATLGQSLFALGTPHPLPRLQHLSLGDTGACGALFEQLGDGRLPALRTLDLDGCRLGAMTPQRAMRFPSLARLSVDDTHLSVTPPQRLWSADSIPCIQTLRMSRHGLSASNAVALLALGQAVTLREVDLSYGELSASMTLIKASAHSLARITWGGHHTWDGRINAEEAACIENLSKTAFPLLVELDLIDATLDAQMTTLLTPARFPLLTVLSLGLRNGAAFDALMDSPILPQLQFLTVNVSGMLDRELAYDMLQLLQDEGILHQDALFSVW
jgi:hypothetical protein